MYSRYIHFNKYYKKICKHFLRLFLMSTNSLATTEIQEKIKFWNTQKKGANIFNRKVTLEDVKAAKQYGIQFLRIAPDKFVSAHRDFLMGNADNYRGLIKEDLKVLKKIIAMCYKEKLPVVLTMLSLPGSRWKQNNQDRDDLRIWKKTTYQLQAAQFWRDLAQELKNEPGIVGYNILNEPHPERIFRPKTVHINTVRQAEVQKILYNVYKRIIESIRTTDAYTPIMLDSSAYADAQTFRLLQPHKDKKLVYCLHIYEPYKYTNRQINKGRFKYPGRIEGKKWDKKALKNYFSEVIFFQKFYKIPSARILVGEFGAHRTCFGLEHYFQDLISIFIQEGWHFAFYAFREDTWDGMDYELGTQRLPWRYWKALEQGKTVKLKRVSTHPAFLIIKKALDASKSSH
ncbi:glycoside hydrolase family 5 protein [Holospora curviuscula]|uniref:Endoglucanase C n=1 Tax=Holospora curviuscula TaxID=1082868 RepID=A0A2S5R8L2_9PROT|nr:cellulase family glycosylhydrolase [Holospora curviuscula]PPE03666.1 Endoglucanase C [Holospora curviuscula]